MFWSLFLIKLQAFTSLFLLKRDSNTGAFLLLFKTFKNTYFEEHLRKAASGIPSFNPRIYFLCEDHFLKIYEDHRIHYCGPLSIFSQENSQFYANSINQKTACSS